MFHFLWLEFFDYIRNHAMRYYSIFPGFMMQVFEKVSKNELIDSWSTSVPALRPCIARLPQKLTREAFHQEKKRFLFFQLTTKTKWSVSKRSFILVYSTFFTEIIILVKGKSVDAIKRTLMWLQTNYLYFLNFLFGWILLIK